MNERFNIFMNENKGEIKSKCFKNLSKEGKEGIREIVREKESCTNNHTHQKKTITFHLFIYLLLHKLLIMSIKL